MRKLLPLILLAVGALFLLSSCDALLDAIYANNTITVNAYVSVGYYGVGLANNSNSYVVVTLSGASGATASAYWSGYDSSISGITYADYYIPEFKKLPNGDYVITATFFGYVGPGWIQYPSVSYGISMPYYGSNTATVPVFP